MNDKVTQKTFQKKMRQARNVGQRTVCEYPKCRAKPMPGFPNCISHHSRKKKIDSIADHSRGIGNSADGIQKNGNTQGQHS